MSENYSDTLEIKVSGEEKYEEKVNLAKTLIKIYNELKKQCDIILKTLAKMGIQGGDLGLPPVDVIDEGDRYHIVVDLPGFSPNEIEVSIVSDFKAIRIKGRRIKAMSSGGKYIVKERPPKVLEFERIIKLPTKIDPSGSEAKFRYGELHIFVRKRHGEMREISIAELS